MMRKIIRIGFILFAIFFTMPLYAVQISGLYTIQIPVATQSDEAKEAASKQGFLQMLIKLTGDAQIENNPVIKENLPRADYYVSQVSYSPVTTDSYEYQLTIQFDKADVDRLLKRASIAFWGDNRPVIMAWLAVYNQDTQNTDLVGSETPSAFLTALQVESKKYALPMIFPVLDMADLSQVSYQDVASLSLPTLQVASTRYAPNGILVGAIDTGQAGSDGRFLLFFHNQRWQWYSQATDPLNLVSGALAQVSRIIAANPVEKPKVTIPTHWITLEVANVVNDSNMKQIIAYLRKKAMVAQVQWMEKSGSVLEVSVLVQGPLDQFLKTVLADERLIPDKSMPDTDRTHYVWVQ